MSGRVFWTYARLPVLSNVSPFGSWGLLDLEYTFHRPRTTRTTILGPFFRLSPHNPALLFVHQRGSCWSQKFSQRLSFPQERGEFQVLIKPFWMFLLTLREFACIESVHSTEFFPPPSLCLSFLCSFLLLIFLCLLDVNYFQLLPFSWRM